MRHTDPYDAIAVGAQFYELNHGAQVRHRVESLLPHISPPRVGVLDVGAGSGTPTLAMARTWPGVPVHAVEPSRSMRIALLTRIAEEGDLQRQVTVHPVAAHELTRTGFVDLVTAFWALGMVEPDHWEATLNALVGALVPGGALLTESSLGEAEEDAAAVQDYRGSTRLGEHTSSTAGTWRPRRTAADTGCSPTAGSMPTGTCCTRTTTTTSTARGTRGPTWRAAWRRAGWWPSGSSTTRRRRGRASRCGGARRPETAQPTWGSGRGRPLSSVATKVNRPQVMSSSASEWRSRAHACTATFIEVRPSCSRCV